MRTRRRPRERPIRLRLLCEPKTSSLYVRVNVWPSKAAMARYRERVRDHPRHAGAIGTCTEIEGWRNGRKRAVVAEVNLCRGRIGTEIVTHEFFHAAIAWGRRRDFDWTRLGAEDSVNAEEERLTYVHSNLCSAFVRRAYAMGLYE